MYVLIIVLLRDINAISMRLKYCCKIRRMICTLPHRPEILSLVRDSESVEILKRTVNGDCFNCSQTHSNCDFDHRRPARRRGGATLGEPTVMDGPRARIVMTNPRWPTGVDLGTSK